MAGTQHPPSDASTKEDAMRTRSFSLNRHKDPGGERRVSLLTVRCDANDVNVDTSNLGSVLHDARRAEPSRGKEPTNLQRSVVPSAAGPRAMSPAGTVPLFLT